MERCAGLLNAIFVALMISCTVANDHCKFWPHVSFLDCSSRGLSSVPVDEIHFNDSLTIDLSSNNISEITNGTFMEASKLQHLDLSNNTIHKLESSAFDGLGNLVSLNLSDNNFNLTTEVFKPKLFTPLVSLAEIRIERYKNPTSLNWKGIDAAFGKLINLTKLFLDLPRDFIFEEGFRGLTKLKTISTFGSLAAVNGCSIETLRNATFEVFRTIAIYELRLINCKIGNIENGAFDPLLTLDVLDLSYNLNLGMHKALYSLSSLRKRNMTEIILSVVNNASCYDFKNFVFEIEDFRFIKDICVKSVDISLNYIAFIDDSAEPRFNFECLERLNMSYHSLRCLPVDFLYSLSLAEVLTTFDLSHGYGTPESRGYHVPLIHPDKIKAIFALPPNLSTLNISSGGLWLHFDLVFKNASNLKYLDVSFLYIDDCDSPMMFGLDNLKHIDISGMLCKNINAQFFRDFQNIASLALSRSHNIHTALASSSLPFSLLHDLEELDLFDSKLSDLNQGLFLKNKKLKKINLSRNMFQHLPIAISHLVELKELDLSTNDISHFLPEEMHLLQRWMTKRGNNSSFKLVLKGNPLQCTCETVLFIRWLLENKSNLDIDGNYRCFLANGTTIMVDTFGITLKDFEVKCVSRAYLTISVVGSLTLLIMFIVLTAIYRYRLNLRYWLYTKLKPPENLFLDREYTYDAFVGYTSDDYNWVYNHLRQKLENDETHFQLCFHDRDFIPGKRIHENIVDNIKQSRKTLLVISMAFLESTYGPLEIEYAGMKCLDEGRDDVIVCVLMEDIPVRQMPKALRNLWHKITFIKWGSQAQDETIFWRNLIDSLRYDDI